MAYALAPHVHAVAVDEDLVLLDVAADRYLCLPSAAAEWRDGSDTGDPDSVWLALAEQGLAVETARAGPIPRTKLDLPERDILDAASSPPRPRDVWNLTWAYVDVLLDYRPRRFAAVLARVRRDCPSSQPVTPPELRRLCGVFHALAVWFPVSAKCLERSFFLLRFLQRSGADAGWMFGVRVWPFGAHCWLQVEDVALDDAAERLAAYTPILTA